MNNEKRWQQRFESFEKSFKLFCRRQEEYEKNPNNEAYQMSFVQSYKIWLLRGIYGLKVAQNGHF